MVRRIVFVVGGIVAAASAWMVFVLVAMRTKSPRMLAAVRGFNREFTNKLQRRSAGSSQSSTALIRHRGRSSGRVYETPIVPFAHGDELLVALPYGPGTDWLRNSIAAGGAELVFGGETLALDQPEVVPVAAMGDAFPPNERRTHRIFGVEHCARFRRVDVASEANDTSAT